MDGDGPGPEGVRQPSALSRRLGWLVLIAVVVAAFTGLLGPGPLSRASASDPAGLVELEYSRFTRQLANTALRVTITPEVESTGSVRLWISSAYLAEASVQQVVPEPVAWVAADGGAVLVFPLTDRAAPVTVRIQLQPNWVGLLRGEIGVVGRQPIRFWQFAYP